MKWLFIISFTGCLMCIILVDCKDILIIENNYFKL